VSDYGCEEMIPSNINIIQTVEWSVLWKQGSSGVEQALSLYNKTKFFCLGTGDAKQI